MAPGQSGQRAMTTPFVQACSGRAVDLIDPLPSQIHFGDIAEGLAKIARFAGATPAGPYSVAQHCVIGADILLERTKDPRLALAFLLHDAHEAYIGDITSPAKRALVHLGGQLYGAGGAAAVEAALARLAGQLDHVIYVAAGFGWPLDGETTRAVHAMDRAMLALERRDLLNPSHRPWDAGDVAKPPYTRGRIAALPWPAAAEEWTRRLTRWTSSIARQRKTA